MKAIGLRLGGNAHDSAEQVELTVDGGVTGDRWASGDDPQRHSQVTLMNSTVAGLIQHSDTKIELSGDNFFVDLDLSEENLPPQARVRIGSAVLQLTLEPHRGCSKFAKRFGKDALRWVNEKPTLNLRFRGVHAEVITAGQVAVGDEIVVLRDN